MEVTTMKLEKNLACLSAIILLGTCTPTALAFENWYPSNITPPAGHKYPCALVPLPAVLDGIPEGDRQYINHTYSQILKCLQAKLVMIDTVYQDNQPYKNAFEQYKKETIVARQKILAEPCPAGLEQFRSDVVKALDLQMEFFKAATDMRTDHKSVKDVMALPSGRQASTCLFSAWNKMASRYPNWTPGVKDSVYHHLCALDLF